MSDHVLGNRRLGHIDAEFEEFPMHPWGSPGGIGVAHIPDELSDLSFSIGSSWATALPAPIKAKALTMPSNDGIGLDDQQSGTPVRPQPRQPNPEDAIWKPQSSPGMGRPSEDVELMTESEDLSLECEARSKGDEKGGDE
jgi:hypothetical protein